MSGMYCMQDVGKTIISYHPKHLSNPWSQPLWGCALTNGAIYWKLNTEQAFVWRTEGQLLQMMTVPCPIREHIVHRVPLAFRGPTVRVIGLSTAEKTKRAPHISSICFIRESSKKNVIHCWNEETWCLYWKVLEKPEACCCASCFSKCCVCWRVVV